MLSNGYLVTTLRIDSQTIFTILNPFNGEFVKRIKVPGMNSISQVLPNGDAVLIKADGSALYYNLTDDSSRTRSYRVKGQLERVFMRPDRNKTLFVVQISDLESLFKPPNKALFYSWAFSPDGKKLFLGCKSGRLLIFPLQTTEC